MKEILVEAEIVQAPKAAGPESRVEKAETIEKVELIDAAAHIVTDIVEIISDRFTETMTAAPPAQKVSALSLASIRAKRELQEANRSIVKEEQALPTQPFSETDMQLQWNKYAQRLGDKGQKIMESLLLISDPRLEGTTIIHELPNEGSSIEFENEKNELLGYLRGKLHNHDIHIRVIVNESVENKFAFTAQDKYNRLNQINPTLDVLKKTFDLDI